MGQSWSKAEDEYLIELVGYIPGSAIPNPSLQNSLYYSWSPIAAAMQTRFGPRLPGYNTRRTYTAANVRYRFELEIMPFMVGITEEKGEDAEFIRRLLKQKFGKAESFGKATEELGNPFDILAKEVNKVVEKYEKTNAKENAKENGMAENERASFAFLYEAVQRMKIRMDNDKKLEN